MLNVEKAARYALGNKSDAELASMISDTVILNHALSIESIDESYFTIDQATADRLELQMIDPDEIDTYLESIQNKIMDIESDILAIVDRDPRICVCAPGTYTGIEIDTVYFIDDKFPSIESALRASVM